MRAHFPWSTSVLCSVAIVAFSATGCTRSSPADTPFPADGETFRGIYETGPSRSVFLPCGSDEQWYVWAQSSPARELRRLTNIQDMQGPGGGMSSSRSNPQVRRAYAEVQGDTVAVTAKQPAIPYDRELRLTHVLKVQPVEGPVCPDGADNVDATDLARRAR